MGLLSAIVLGADIFVLALMLEIALDFIRPARVMRTDHQTPQEARRSRRSLRIVLVLLIAICFVALWASWRFVLSGLFR